MEAAAAYNARGAGMEAYRVLHAHGHRDHRREKNRLQNHHGLVRWDEVEKGEAIEGGGEIAGDTVGGGAAETSVPPRPRPSAPSAILNIARR